MFGFGKRKKGPSQELQAFVEYHKATELLEKGKNLVKLGRTSEATEVFSEAELIAAKAANKFPRSVQAHVSLALIYQETQQFDRTEAILERLLNSNDFSLDDEQRTTLRSELYKIKREEPARTPGGDVSETGFTTVYSCQNCGRLINYVSMPCQHCLWYPGELAVCARSIVLSSDCFTVPQLLLIARSISTGRTASDVVRNLEERARQAMEMPESQSRLRHLFDLLHKNAPKNARDINQMRSCFSCGKRLLLSNIDECQECGEVIDLPDSVRLLMCVDNLLWLFEQRVEPAETDAFSEFVSILVAIENDMLRKQEAPPLYRRTYALSLLQKMKGIDDKNRGAVIETTNLNKIKICLIKQNMVEDTESFVPIYYIEIVQFVSFMRKGVSK
jgi:tetratricopeptide (TPR) repeat protein